MSAGDPFVNLTNAPVAIMFFATLPPHMAGRVTNDSDPGKCKYKYKFNYIYTNFNANIYTNTNLNSNTHANIYTKSNYICKYKLQVHKNSLPPLMTDDK